MSSLIFIIFIFSLTHSFLAQITDNPNGFLLKVNKDLQTQQYTTQLLIGTPQLPTKLVVHLSGDSLWLHCSTSSPSHQFIPHNSIQCLLANKSQKPTTHPKICNIQQRNPITGISSFGDLAEDHIDIGSGSNRVLFSCLSSDYLLKGLVSDAKGVLGLGKSKIAFQSQIVNNFDFPRKFTVCLSSVNGFISSRINTKCSLSYTPLIINSIHDVNAYYVNVNSIKINRKKLSLQQPIGSVEISSVVPYTRIESTIYENFVKGYVAAAISMNMTMVGPVSPFGVCFITQEVVPEIELVLQSEFVKWKIHGKNLMVRVSDSVMCLGFVDGGFNMKGLMVLGGYQLEDRILEFNLGTGMMGFSSSLMMDGNGCSNVMELVSTRKESL